MTKHLSFSQLSKWIECPARWQFSRQQPEPPGWQAKLGQCVHGVLELAQKDRAEGRPVPELDDLLERFRVNWPAFAADPEIRWYDMTPDRAAIRGEAMLTAVHEYLPVITPISPTAVEMKLSIPLNVPGWTFDGVIDLVTTRRVLVDWKTTSKPWDKDAVAKNLQATAYYWLYHTATGLWPAGFTFAVMTLGKNETEATFQSFPTTRTEAQVAHFRHMANSVARAIDAGAIFPNLGFTWCHTCTWRNPCEKQAAGVLL